MASTTLKNGVRRLVELGYTIGASLPWSFFGGGSIITIASHHHGGLLGDTSVPFVDKEYLYLDMHICSLEDTHINDICPRDQDPELYDVIFVDKATKVVHPGYYQHHPVMYHAHNGWSVDFYCVNFNCEDHGQLVSKNRINDEDLEWQTGSRVFCPSCMDSIGRYRPYTRYDEVGDMSRLFYAHYVGFSFSDLYSPVKRDS